MSEPFDWAEAGKKAQAEKAAKDAQIKATEADRQRTAAAEQVQTQVLLQRSWALVGELQKTCAEIATAYNRSLDLSIRLNVLGGGLGRFSVIRGTYGFPRLEFTVEGADHIEIQQVESSRPSAGAMERLTVEPTGDLLLRRGTQLLPPAEVASAACKWLINAKMPE